MAESEIIMHQPQAIRPDERPMMVDRSVNVGDLERWISLLGGSALALYTVRRSLGPFVLLFGAGALIYRGLTGHCALYQQMGVSTELPDTAPGSPRDIAESPSRIVIAQS